MPADITCQKVKNEAGEEVSARRELLRPSLCGWAEWEIHYNPLLLYIHFHFFFLLLVVVVWGFWALMFALFVLGFDCVCLLPLAETDDSILHS